MTCNCPYCNKPAKLVSGDKIYTRRPDLHALNFWLCPPCDAYVGCHRPGARTEDGISDGTMPLGRLANAELRRAKSKAHAAFDPIWKFKRMSRKSAYRWLAKKLGIPEAQCHIGYFDVEMCERTIQACGTKE